MRHKRILIVDDEKSVLTSLEASLERLGPGLTVVTAADGLTAKDHIQTQTFDLVVTDYNMPGLNGLELLEVTRLVQPEARVILMTGDVGGDLEARAQRLHAYCYLPKPFKVDVFRQVIREALDDIPASDRQVYPCPVNDTGKQAVC